MSCRCFCAASRSAETSPLVSFSIEMVMIDLRWQKLRPARKLTPGKLWAKLRRGDAGAAKLPRSAGGTGLPVRPRRPGSRCGVGLPNSEPGAIGQARPLQAMAAMDVLQRMQHEAEALPAAGPSAGPGP